MFSPGGRAGYIGNFDYLPCPLSGDFDVQDFVKKPGELGNNCQCAILERPEEPGNYTEKHVSAFFVI